MVALLGANGAGKSTTMRALSAACCARSAATIVLDDERVERARGASDRRARARAGAGRPAGVPRARACATTSCSAPITRRHVDLARRSSTRCSKRFPRLRERLDEPGRAALRRRAADAGDRARADGEAAHPAARRAVARACARDDQRTVRRPRRAARRRRHHPAGRPDGGAGADRRRSRLCAGIRPHRARRHAPTRWRTIRRWRRPISAARKRRSRRWPLDLVLRNARIAGRDGPTSTSAIGDGRDRRRSRRASASDAPSEDVGGRLVVPGLRRHPHPSRQVLHPRPLPHRAGHACRRRSPQVAAAKRAFTEDDVYARARRTLEKAILQGTTAHAHPCRGRPAHRADQLQCDPQLKADYAWAIDLETLRVPAGRPDQRSRHRGAAGRGLRGGRRPDRRLPLYRQRSARPDRAHLRASRGASTSTSTSISTSISTRPGCTSTRSAGRPTRIATAAASRSATSPSCRRCRPREFDDTGAAPRRRRRRRHGAAGDRPVPDGPRPRPQRAARRRRRAHRLLAHGVTCSLATNNVLNPFTPFGDCSLIRMANLYANIAQLGDAPRLVRCLDMVTTQPAKLMNLADYGIAVGNPADLVVLDCRGGGGRGRRARRSRCSGSSAAAAASPVRCQLCTSRNRRPPGLGCCARPDHRPRRLIP